MSEFDSDGPKPWTYYTSSNLTWPGNADGEGRAPRGFASPMNAYSFGFIATAILVSLFLVMAIFEHLFGPSPSFASPEPILVSSMVNAAAAGKSKHLCPLEHADGLEITVMMPGDRHPSYIAQPAPLPPSCPREGIDWPHH